MITNWITKLAGAAALTVVLAACAEPMITGGGMQQPAASPAPAAGESGAVQMPSGLSADERVIWNSMTPEAQRRAVEYIAAGGTFRQFVTL